MKFTAAIFVSLLFISNAFGEADQYGPDVVKELIRRLDEKDVVIERLVTKVGVLENRLDEMGRSMDAVKAQTDDQVSKLNEVVESQSREIARLSELAHAQASAETKLRPTSDNSSDSANNQDREVPVKSQMVPSQHPRTTRQVEGLTAFFAVLTPTVNNHLGVGQNIIFDDVITNIGNAYNSHQGIFVAPVSGTYVFSATLLSHLGHNSHFYFAKNGSVVSRLYVGGLSSSSSTYDTSSQTVILSLNPGDDVSVRNADADENIWGDMYTSFAGFLLQEGFEEPSVVGK